MPPLNNSTLSTDVYKRQGQEGAWPYLGIDAFDEIKSQEILVNTDFKVGDGGTDYSGDIGLISLGFTDGPNKGYALSLIHI